MKLSVYPNCPICDRIDLLRIRRRWWMRLVWGSKHLKCLVCGESFVFIRPSRIIRFVALTLFVIFLFIFMRDLIDQIPYDSGRIIGRGFAVNDSKQIAGNGYLEGEYRALPLIPKSKPTIDSILNFFDQSVKAGTLAGEGYGSSAYDRLNSVRDMLKVTGDLISVGDIEDACEQSKAALGKSEYHLSQPRDFVSGPAVSELYDMIEDLMTELKC